MTFYKINFSQLFSLFILIMIATYAQADQTIVTINTIPITDRQLDDAVKAAVVQNNQKDTPEFRQLMLEELIGRELVFQDAEKKRYEEKSAELQLAIRQVRQVLIVNAYLEEITKKNNPTEADIHKEFDRQYGGKGKVLTEYHLQHVLLGSEEEGKRVLEKINTGEGFDKVAKEFSLDKQTATKDGELGWVLPNQIIRPLGDVIVNMIKGSVTQAPVQTQLGWHVVRLMEKRNVNAPAFESVKDNLKTQLIIQMRQKYINDLKFSAKIEKLI